MQFHLELTLTSIHQMIESGREELTSGKYVQTEQEILTYTHLIESNRKIMFTLLDRLAE